MSKQPPSNPTLILLPAYINFGASLLIDVERKLMLSSDNPLDFHSEI